MLQVHCSGTPYAIGHAHGTAARPQIEGSIAFYTGLFKETAKLDWPRVRTTALEFEPVIRRKWPAYLEEMRGIAEGAGVELADVLALNVRTEIAFGLFSDGCTMLAWHSTQPSGSAFIAQNWDWMPQQRANLIALSIEQQGFPSIKMITEGGIIGKIGLNSAGVGCTLNAIRALGMDPTRMPCHLALRAVLESPTRDAAVATLDKHGVASSCTISVADAAAGSVCLEWSAVDVQKLFPDEAGRIYHSNHYLVEHSGAKDTVYLPDSIPRVKRIRELVEGLGTDEPSVGDLMGVFKDEQDFPRGINRKEAEGNHSETLFTIICDLRAKKAYVSEGRPTEAEGSFELEL
ncbi:Peptidase C45 acyl-coenzyme A:6-aminopenicillanic acid acyl-transferase [Macrophomina phaseolina MS6]|uniref:Peptidase C45 acyl-coenzyme A:6-aminopenicillanic acid acyl-transferase n=1 Tax=Macrophomina phaseolina (strain MS6) TaxID=1126212 RepID=K2SGX2_MACPH|nr:Peptidase C45 acyl-coenzyme A:6-aminopenicillanic acid acyl-transferase [Macrophomina phaseolina MS6]